MSSTTNAPTYGGCQSNDASVVRLELHEGQTLTRADIDRIERFHNRLIFQIRKLEKELEEYKK